MTDMTARKIVKKAKFNAEKIFDNQQTAEELSQDVIVSFCEKKKEGQSVKQAVIDAVRARYGKPSYKSNKERLSKDLNWKQLKPQMAVVKEEDFDFDRIIRSVDIRMRSILILYFKWGFTEEEIAHCLSLGRSRISQLLSEGLLELRSNLTEESIRVSA